MQHLPPSDVLKRAIRAKVCTACYQRPAGSEALPADVPRACEPLCPIFQNVPRLFDVAAACAGGARYEDAVKQLACAQCSLSPSSGEYCSEYGARTCPLSRYARDVLQLIEQVVPAAAPRPSPRA